MTELTECEKRGEHAWVDQGGAVCRDCGEISTAGGMLIVDMSLMRAKCVRLEAELAAYREIGRLRDLAPAAPKSEHLRIARDLANGVRGMDHEYAAKRLAVAVDRILDHLEGK